MLFPFNPEMHTDNYSTSWCFWKNLCPGSFLIYDFGGFEKLEKQRSQLQMFIENLPFIINRNNLIPQISIFVTTCVQFFKRKETMDEQLMLSYITHAHNRTMSSRALYKFFPRDYLSSNLPKRIFITYFI